MARSLDWSSAASRSRARRQGSEDTGGRVNGASARKDAADADVITKILRCPCGHRGKVEMPAAMLAGRKFKCSACGRRT